VKTDSSYLGRPTVKRLQKLRKHDNLGVIRFLILMLPTSLPRPGTVMVLGFSLDCEGRIEQSAHSTTNKSDSQVRHFLQFCTCCTIGRYSDLSQTELIDNWPFLVLHSLELSFSPVLPPIVQACSCPEAK
jgi:hypothetical protein